MFQTEYMEIALNQAQKAYNCNEVPVGAVITTASGEILAQTHNLCETQKDVTAHAEILAIKKAAQKLGHARLTGCDLWVTLEPCAMCAAAIAFSRIKRLYFGAFDPKGGGVFAGPCLFNQPTIFHKPEIYGGILEDQSRTLLQSFFLEKRGKIL